MILNSSEANARLNSPDNLINQLRARMSSGAVSNKLMPFGFDRPKAEAEIVSLPPTIDNLIDNIDEKINEGINSKKLDSVKANAVHVLDAALEMLKVRVAEVERPKDLAKIATDMSRIINDESNSSKVNNFNQVIVYKPIAMNENHYETIRVHE